MNIVFNDNLIYFGSFCHLQRSPLNLWKLYAAIHFFGYYFIINNDMNGDILILLDIINLHRKGK